MTPLNETRDEDYAPGPREDWYCRCCETAPDRIGTVPVLRPARQARCSVCFTDAPWSALRGDGDALTEISRVRDLLGSAISQHNIRRQPVNADFITAYEILVGSFRGDELQHLADEIHKGDRAQDINEGRDAT